MNDAVLVRGVIGAVEPLLVEPLGFPVGLSDASMGSGAWNTAVTGASPA